MDSRDKIMQKAFLAFLLFFCGALSCSHFQFPCSCVCFHILTIALLSWQADDVFKLGFTVRSI